MWFLKYPNICCFLFGHRISGFAGYENRAGHCWRCGATAYTNDRWWPRLGDQLRDLKRQCFSSTDPF